MKTISALLLLVVLCLPARVTRAEIKLTPFGGAVAESKPNHTAAPQPFVKGGIDDRPYLLRSGKSLALGGYVDLLGSYHQQEGISDGVSFEARRFNIFLTSQMVDFLRVSAEIEFEHGPELALEMALVDVLLHHAINLRAGILLVPIGRFNITHDSPRYDLVDRPLVSTHLLAATWADVGGGIFGSLYPGSHKLTYELYVINGLGDGVLAAEGTRLAAGKAISRFEEDNNGRPAITGRLAYQPPIPLEVGLSFYTGIYNRFTDDGLTLDHARWLWIAAVDAETEWRRIYARGEAAMTWIDTPPSQAEITADRQWGGYLETGVHVLQRSFWRFTQMKLTAVARFDYVDLNIGTRSSTGESIGDEITRLSVGLSFRPVNATSIRLCYHYNWNTDVFGRLSQSAGLQLGIATYF